MSPRASHDPFLKVKVPAARPRQAPRLQLNHLEERAVPSATISRSVLGDLRIIGSNANEEITVTVQSGLVKVDYANRDFPFDRQTAVYAQTTVKSVLIDGLGGNDVITNSVLLP